MKIIAWPENCSSEATGAVMAPYRVMRGEAMNIVGIDVWHDTICQAQPKSRESGRHGS